MRRELRTLERQIFKRFLYLFSLSRPMKILKIKSFKNDIIIFVVRMEKINYKQKCLNRSDLLTGSMF